jgi:hypothetical protein
MPPCSVIKEADGYTGWRKRNGCFSSILSKQMKIPSMEKPGFGVFYALVHLRDLEPLLFRASFFSPSLLSPFLLLSFSSYTFSQFFSPIFHFFIFLFSLSEPFRPMPCEQTTTTFLMAFLLCSPFKALIDHSYPL